MAKQVSYLTLVKSCDDFPYGSAAESYYQLYLPDDDEPHGYMLPEIVQKMPWTAAFTISHDHPRRVTVKASDGTDRATAVSEAFRELIAICIERDLFHVLCRQHSEPFAITSARYSTPVHVERFATSLFGLTTRGAHLVAYVGAGDAMRIWIPRRAAQLYMYPSKLDTSVAGGVKAGVSPFQTIVEEAHEEASLPEQLVRSKCRSRGAISHMAVTGKGFPGEKGLAVPDFIWTYDIELPGDVVPKPFDDEVSGFTSMSVAEVQAALLREEFKPDSAAVLIEFLMRHSFITPENEKDFVEITMRLHRKLPFRTGGA